MPDYAPAQLSASWNSSLSEKVQHPFGRAADYGFPAGDEDGPFDEDGILGHGPNPFVVGNVGRLKPEFAVPGFAAPHELKRCHAQLAQQSAQRGFVRRVFQIAHHFKINIAFLEKRESGA